MSEDNFEWDETKAAANRKDHGVTFQLATQVFNDHFAVEWIDEREYCGEERINRLGMCNGVILHVTYTERDERFRIISARRAERHGEQYDYRENAF